MAKPPKDTEDIEEKKKNEKKKTAEEQSELVFTKKDKKVKEEVKEKEEVKRLVDAVLEISETGDDPRNKKPKR